MKTTIKSKLPKPNMGQLIMWYSTPNNMFHVEIYSKAIVVSAYDINKKLVSRFEPITNDSSETGVVNSIIRTWMNEWMIPQGDKK